MMEFSKLHNLFLCPWRRMHLTLSMFNKKCKIVPSLEQFGLRLPNDLIFIRTKKLVIVLLFGYKL